MRTRTSVDVADRPSIAMAFPASPPLGEGAAVEPRLRRRHVGPAFGQLEGDRKPQVVAARRNSSSAFRRYGDTTMISLRTTNWPRSPTPLDRCRARFVANSSRRSRPSDADRAPSIAHCDRLRTVHHRRIGAPRRPCKMTYQVSKRRRGWCAKRSRRFFDPPQFHGSSKYAIERIRQKVPTEKINL